MNITLGRIANLVPYRFIPRVGKIYSEAQREISVYEKSKDKKRYIYERVYSIVEYAINNIKFYRDFYASKGFSLDMLRNFDDIEKIPIISKQDLVDVALEDRSANVSNAMIVNTGGSTGLPLTFYKLKSSRIKEMAYYHFAWKRLGYKKSQVRLQFVGRQETKGLKYDLARNQLRVSVYEPFKNILKELISYNKSNVIKFLQGYPSVLYEFAVYCSLHKEEYKESHLDRSLNGVFLNSEFPQSLYRKKIEEVFGVHTMASYGHTEGLCLGFDNGGCYRVMQSYGFSECVEMPDGKHLVGTTYDNFVSPLIRYDTNDIMDEVKYDGGILSSFIMTNGGRNGQYIEDFHGKKISLTGLIFGKHHELFNYCTQLQISQSERGKATIYYVPAVDLPINFDPALLFDSEGIAIELSFKMIEKPIKTKAGKVLLLVKEQ